LAAIRKRKLTLTGVDIAQALLPADHPDRLIMENAYARALINVDREAEAEPLFRDAANAEDGCSAQITTIRS